MSRVFQHLNFIISKISWIGLVLLKVIGKKGKKKELKNVESDGMTVPVQIPAYDVMFDERIKPGFPMAW